MKRAISLAGRGKSSGRKVVYLPEFCGIKLLAKAAKSTPESVLKALGYRRDKRLHFEFLNQRFAFKSMNSIVIPFPVAARFLLSRGVDVRFQEVAMTEHEHSQMHKQLPVQQRGVVAAMLGHYSHGKTSILDALAGTNTAGKGITQEIRCVRVEEGRNGVENLREIGGGITFIDTPGQDIFHRMRTQGSRLADLGVLVVSAVEGICSQTKESIGCAEESGIPLVAAINKVDLLTGGRQARVDELIQEIREYTALEHSPVVLTSAATGEGLPQLISTVRDIALASLSKGQFWFRPDATARGVVMNLMKAKGQGYVLKVRLEDGTLSVGDLFVAGEWSGKVRALYDENGSSTKAIAAGRVVDVAFSVRSSTESSPVSESFYVVPKDRMEAMIEQRMMAKNLQLHIVDSPKVSAPAVEGTAPPTQRKQAKSTEYSVFLRTPAHNAAGQAEPSVTETDAESDSEADAEEEEDDRPLLVVKTDSAGTLGVVVDALASDDSDHETDDLSPNLRARLVHGSVGEVIPRDIMMASALDQEVLCFNVAVSAEARRKAKESNVAIREFSILQDLLDHIAAKAGATRGC